MSPAARCSSPCRGEAGATQYFDLTGADGNVPLGPDSQPGVPSGVLTIKASVIGETGQVLDTATLVLDSARLTRRAAARH